MYAAIAAISRDGVIETLEPVVFDDNEQLVILRLSKPFAAAGAQPLAGGDWRAWVGRLKASPNWNDDAVASQREMRREWD